MPKLIAATLFAALMTGCATTSHAPASVPAAARAELAPTGTLRAAMNMNNVYMVTKDPASGELRGVSVDLMHELGKRLGVPVQFIGYPSPGEISDAARSNAWDVAMLAIEATRAETIAFSPAMTEIEATYMVRGDSPLKTAAQADAPGIRISASEKAGYELFLSRNLRQATVVRAKGDDASFKAFTEQRLDAWANLKPRLLLYLPRLPGARLLDGAFMSVQHGIGTPRDRRAGAEYLKQFVEEMNASGFVARSIERHRIPGLSPIKR